MKFNNRPIGISNIKKGHSERPIQLTLNLTACRENNPLREKNFNYEDESDRYEKMVNLAKLEQEKRDKMFDIKMKQEILRCVYQRILDTQKLKQVDL